MRSLRRHYLYASQEDETSVGDSSAKSCVLGQWLARRRRLLHDDTAVVRFSVLFWTLAKPSHAVALAKSEYVAFFQNVAKALVQSVGVDHAAIVAARDWLYDCAGSFVTADTSEDSLAMSLGQFQEALLQCADLVLPVESDASMFASFFQELRDAIATPTDVPALPGSESTPSPQSLAAASFVLRPLRDVVKIRGAFLQKMPPNADHLALVRGLPSPDMDSMSLKQLLLSYNPRKFSLSRKFSSLFTQTPDAPPASPLFQLVESPSVASLASSTPLAPSKLLSRESDDAFDPEEALVRSIESFPALRVAVVGPPGAGKTRLARSLAQRLELQYVSTVEAIEKAVVDQRARNAARSERRRQRAEAREAALAAAEAADTAGVDTETEQQISPQLSDVDEETEPMDEAELLFGDADLAALERGEALSPERALPLLVAFAREILLRGVGVVLDDVFPDEVEDSLAIDYVVSLEMSREDAKDNVAGFALAPTSKRVYSARERAMLSECDAELRERGFADGPLFVASSQEQSTKDTELISRRAKVADAIAAVTAAMAASKTTAVEGSEGTEGDQTTLEEAAVTETAEEHAPVESVPPTTEVAPAQRNDVAPLGEPTVPLRGLYLDAFSARYRDFQARAATLTSSKRTQVVPVNAAQALHDIVEQCVVAMTNSSAGLCRSAWSRTPLRITLPDEIAASESRADRLRWLLYGDWTEWLALLAPTPFSHGPSDPRQPRQLSRWRDCCIVSSSSASSPILGDPQYAAYFSGRVYLFASELARDSFCTAPLQFLRRSPSLVPSARKVWILASGSLDPLTSQALANVVEGVHVSTTQVLSAHHSLQQIMELTEGRTLNPASAASLVADSLVDKSAWVLTELEPTKEMISILHERGCLPDAIVLLEVKETDVGSLFRTPLERKKHELWISKVPLEGSSPLSDLLTEAQLTVPILRSQLFEDPADCQAALLRALSPLAPRVDTAGDGTFNESQEEHTRVFAPEDDPKDPQDDIEEEDGDDHERKEADAVGYSKKQQTKMARRNRMGETAQFCAVTWKKTRRLVPGLPEFVASFGQKLYAFAGQKERAAFERHPTKYLPRAARATLDFVPVVWLFGVQGSDHDVLAQGLIQNAQSVRIGLLDNAAVATRVEQRLRVQLLRLTDKQTAMSDLYVDELGREIGRMVESNQWDIVLVTTISVASIAVPPQLGEENAEPASTPSRLPTPDLITACFQLGLFPNLVVAIDASEDTITKRQLARWREAQAPKRPNRKLMPAGGEDADEGELDPVDPAVLEANEIARLQEQFQEDRDTLALALDTIRARGLTVEAVKGDATQRALIKSVADIVRQLLDRKDSQFEFCERVSHSRARNLIRSGEATVGKHAILCPISGRLSSSPSPPPALLYRGRIYFPHSLSVVVKCEQAPAAILVEPPSQPPHTVGTCCIVGPPGVGKTRLAQGLAASLGLTYVSPQNAVEWVHQCLGPQSTLWSKIKTARAAGSRLLDVRLLHEVIHTRLSSSECQRKGWVLDGYMLTSSELALCLNAQNQAIHPAVVFCLDGSLSQSWQSRRESPSESIEMQYDHLVEAFGAWRQHRLDLLHTWSSTFGSFHIREINTDSNSVWQVHAQARDVLEQLISLSRKYFQDLAMQRSARLHGVVRTHDTLTAQTHHEYQSFCPVELSAGRYYASVTDNREFCIEIIDETGTPIVLWIASALNLHAFCSSPRDFLDLEVVDRTRGLVQKAPVDASLLSLLSVPDCEFPEMKGYCPVTFQQGTGDKDWQAIVKGSVFYRASYENKVFFCISERKRRAFIAEPVKYANQILPIKLPPQIGTPLAYKNCPGRIEQELSGVLNETLMLLGAARPKFLGVSTSSSACFYLALLLKTRATKALPDHIRARYVDRLRSFERDCRIGEQLKALISPNGTTSCGPGIKGARAVRELSATSSEAELQLPVSTVGDDLPTIEFVSKRFDELVSSCHPLGCSNQEHPTLRQNDRFLEYAKSLTATNNAS